MYTFMDTETYEQTELNKEQLGDALNYLMENMEVSLQTFKGRIIGIQLPNSVNLKVVECEPSVKGNTATGATKIAKVETGYEVRVPLFAAAAPGMFMQLVQQLHFFHFYFVLFSFLAGKSVRVRE